VEGYESLVAGLELPDKDDRHVLAAAIRANAQVIVTQNTRDFPADVLGSYGIEAQTSDEFLLHQDDLDPRAMLETLTSQAAALKKPARTLNELLDLLANFAPRAIARLRSVFP